MSQEKVDRYKKEKANRKQNVKKEKFANAVRKFIVMVVGVMLVVWIGYSAYDLYDSNKEPEQVQIDYRAFDDFTQGITEAAANAAEETETKE